MKKEWLFIVLLLLLAGAFFFYKTLIFGLVPFPGDLLVAEYNPWKTYSYLGYVPGSFPNKAQYFDVLRQLYPWKTFTIDSLKNLQLPLWNPYSFSGAPLLANFQSAIFYPLNIIYFLVPQIIAWSVLIFLQPFLVLFFAFLYSRKIGISKLGSLFSALSFAFSSFMTVWLEYNTIGQVILWLPLLLLSIEKLLEKRELKWMLIFVFSIVSSLLAGHIQIFIYLFIFVLLYVLIRMRFLNWETENRKNLTTFFIILFLLPLGISAVQLIPGIELILQSARSPHTYDFFMHKILIQPWQLIMLFVPDFFGNPATRNYWVQDTYVGDVMYIGIVPLFFVISSLFNFKNYHIRFFWISAGIVLILITLNPLSWVLYSMRLDFLSSSATNLAVFIFLFSLSILCGFGVDQFRADKQFFKKYLISFLPIFTIFVGLWMVILTASKLNISSLTENLSISKHNLIYSSAIFILASILLFLATFRRKLIYIFLVALFLLHGFDLWRSFDKFNPFVPKELVFPNAPVSDFLKKNAGINRMWGYGAASIEANFATQLGLFSPDGYDPLYPKRYGEFIQSSRDGAIHTDFNDQTRSDAVIAPGFGEKDLPNNNSRLKLLDLLGVKYVLDRTENASTQNTFTVNRFNMVYEKDGWRIFENKKALSRIFLASNYKVAKSKEEFEKIFFGKDFDMLKTVILEQDIKEKLNDSNHLTKVQLLSYKPNEIRISTSSDGNKLLFLSDTYYPGWKAYIDGKETTIYRSDYAFRSIYIPNGDHEIKFVFIPSSFRIGYMTSLLSVFCLIVFLALFVKRRPHGI